MLVLGIERSFLTRPLITRLLVFQRLRTIRRVTPTWALVRARFFTTQPGMPTQPPVQKRSCTTRPAPSTRPLAQGRLIATPVATITGRSGTVRFGTPYALE